MKQTILLGFVFLIFLSSVYAGCEDNFTADDLNITFFTQSTEKIWHENKIILATNLDNQIDTFSINNNKNWTGVTATWVITEEDLTKVDCSTTGGVPNRPIADATENYEGSAFCKFGYSGCGVVFENLTIPFTVYNELVEQQEITPSSGGVSEPPEPEIITVQVVNNSLLSIINEATETLLGEKIIVSKGDVLFEIYTDFQTDYFEIYASPGETKKRNLFVRNNGLEPITLLISCQGTFCNQITISRNVLVVNANTEEKIPIEISVPSSAKEDTVFQFNTLVSLQEDVTLSGVVSGKVIVSKFLGKLSSIVSLNHLFNEGFYIGNILIPNILISLIATVFYFSIITLLITRIKPRGAGIVAIELLRWLGSIFVFVFVIFIL